MKKHAWLVLFVAGLLGGGCSVVPTLREGYEPLPPEVGAGTEPRPELIIAKVKDASPQYGTTPIAQAFIPFWPYVSTVDTPEAFVYRWNRQGFDYKKDFAELVAEDLRNSGLFRRVVIDNDGSKTGLTLDLTITNLQWKNRYTLYGLTIAGFIPQALGAPDSYGFSELGFKAELLDADGKSLGRKKLNAIVSQNGWIYYISGYLRALTEAYGKLSPELRLFVRDAGDWGQTAAGGG